MGRRTDNRRFPVSVSFDQQTIDLIEKRRGYQSRSAWIRQAIRSKVYEERKESVETLSSNRLAAVLLARIQTNDAPDNEDLLSLLWEALTTVRVNINKTGQVPEDYIPPSPEV
jgi:Arc/MetJ-type ribon-helix-helix transcriptional regulator